MNDKEKLVELLRVSPHLDVVKGYKGNDCTFEQGADWLISHSVTVQEWISVEERLPENDYEKHWIDRKHYLVYTHYGRTTVAVYGYKEYPWWIDGQDCVIDRRFGKVTHWMEMPQPPKGE